MKLLLFCFFISSFGLAANKSESELYLMGMKEKDDEEMLLNSDLFKDCQDSLEKFKNDTTATANANQTYLQKLEECVAKKITQNGQGKISPEKLKELSKSLDLASFNKEASSTTQGIQEYLAQRIHKAIYGDTKLSKNEIEKIKNAKLVNHDLFYQMYSEQIGKNVIVTTANYCLENFGYKTPTTTLYLMSEDQNGKPMITDFKTLDQVITDKNSDVATLYSDRYELSNQIDQAITVTPPNLSQLGVMTPTYTHTDENGNTTMAMGLDWHKNEDFFEYELCSATTQKRCDEIFKNQSGDIRPYRPQRIVTLLKDVDLKLAQNDSDKRLIQAKYGYCVNTIIKNMCEIYKCNNSYDIQSPDDIKNNCRDTFGITITRTPNAELSLDTEKKKGYIACNVMARLDEYRKILNGVEQIKAENIAFIKSNPTKGITLDSKKIFTDDNKVNQILSVSSKEISSIDSINNSEDDALALRAECLDEKNPGNEIDGYVFKSGAMENEKCATLLASSDSAEFETVTLDTEAKTKLLEKNLEGLTSTEEIKKYLEEAGLYEKYKDKLDSLTPEQMKSVVISDFKNQRQALIDSLAAKYDQEKNIQVSDEKTVQDANQVIQDEVATQTFEEMQTYKERVDTLFEYSNVISGYLTLTDSESGESVRNSAPMQVEAEADEASEIIKEYYNDGDASSNSGGGEINYQGLINQVLSSKKEEDSSSP